MKITSSISQLIDSGADAFDNLFEVIFDFSELKGLETRDIKDLEQKLTIRTSNFNPPSPRRTEINLPYKSYTIKKPGSTLEVPQKMTFNIRIDKNYDILRALKSIEAQSFKAEKEKYINKLENGFRITVKAYSNPDPSNIKNYSQDELRNRRIEEGGRDWVFENVHIMNITTNEYGHDDKPDPIQAQIEVLYERYEETFLEKRGETSNEPVDIKRKMQPPPPERNIDLLHFKDSPAISDLNFAHLLVEDAIKANKEKFQPDLTKNLLEFEFKKVPEIDVLKPLDTPTSNILNKNLEATIGSSKENFVSNLETTKKMNASDKYISDLLKKAKK